MRATMLPFLSFFPGPGTDTDTAVFLPKGLPGVEPGATAGPGATPGPGVTSESAPGPESRLEPAPAPAPLLHQTPFQAHENVLPLVAPTTPTASTTPTALADTAPLPQRLAALAPPLTPQRSSTAWASAAAQLWRADEPGGAGALIDCAPSGFASLDQALPGGGWPKGQLVELLLDAPGLGELGLMMPALASMTTQGRAAVWVLPHDAPAAATPSIRTPANTSATSAASAGTLAGNTDPLRHCPLHARPYAPALVSAGIDLNRCIFVQPATPREALWTFEQALRAPHLGAVVGWLPDTSSHDAAFRALRRLHLMAQRHQALVFVLRPTCAANTPSPAAVRLQLGHANGALQVRVLKRRGRPLLDPLSLLIATQPALPQPVNAPNAPGQALPASMVLAINAQHHPASAVSAVSALSAIALAQANGVQARFAGMRAKVQRLLPAKVAALLIHGASEPATVPTPNTACAS